MVAVAYEGWSLTRGSKYNDLTWKRLVFWKTGRGREMVATGDSAVTCLCYYFILFHFFMCGCMAGIGKSVSYIFVISNYLSNRAHFPCL